ncbi:MAG: hypothetical protein U0527_02750 [Candidatus Eisenbacteria bacterium]
MASSVVLRAPKGDPLQRLGAVVVGFWIGRQVPARFQVTSAEDDPEALGEARQKRPAGAMVAGFENE